MKVTTLLNHRSAKMRDFGRLLKALGYESTNQPSSSVYPMLGHIAHRMTQGNSHQRRVMVRCMARAARDTYLQASLKHNLASDYPAKFKNEV